MAQARIEIEVCTAQQSAYFRDNSDKYGRTADRLENLLRENLAERGVLQHCSIERNPGPEKGFVPMPGMSEWFTKRTRDGRELKTKYPRNYAFEVTLRSVGIRGLGPTLLLWTKIGTRLWPNCERLAGDVSNLLSTALVGRDINSSLKRVEEMMQQRPAPRRSMSAAGPAALWTYPPPWIPAGPAAVWNPYPPPWISPPVYAVYAEEKIAVRRARSSSAAGLPSRPGAASLGARTLSRPASGPLHRTAGSDATGGEPKYSKWRAALSDCSTRAPSCSTRPSSCSTRRSTSRKTWASEKMQKALDMDDLAFEENVDFVKNKFTEKKALGMDDLAFEANVDFVKNKFTEYYPIDETELRGITLARRPGSTEEGPPEDSSQYRSEALALSRNFYFGREGSIFDELGFYVDVPPGVSDGILHLVVKRLEVDEFEASALRSHCLDEEWDPCSHLYHISSMTFTAPPNSDKSLLVGIQASSAFRYEDASLNLSYDASLCVACVADQDGTQPFDPWEVLPSTVREDGLVCAEVRHFSWFTLASKPWIEVSCSIAGESVAVDISLHSTQKNGRFHRSRVPFWRWTRQVYDLSLKTEGSADRLPVRIQWDAGSESSKSTKVTFQKPEGGQIDTAVFEVWSGNGGRSRMMCQCSVATALQAKNLHDELSAEMWCITPGQLQELREDVQRHYSEKDPDVYEVVSDVIKPLTQTSNVSYALWKNPNGLRATHFVSHAWGEGCLEFCKAIQAQRLQDTAGLWICFTANPQTWSSADLNNLIGPYLWKSPFRIALQDAKYVICLRNTRVQMFTRLWCVYEMFTARDKEKTIILAGQPPAYTATRVTPNMPVGTNAKASDANDAFKLRSALAKEEDKVNLWVQEWMQPTCMPEHLD